jgi:hypothetical protein
MPSAPRRALNARPEGWARLAPASAQTPTSTGCRIGLAGKLNFEESNSPMTPYKMLAARTR